MSTSSIGILSLGFQSSSALAQYQPIQATGSAAVEGGIAFGFTKTAVGGPGERFTATFLGTSVAVAGGAIAAGSFLQVHSNVAQVMTKSTGIIIGIALSSASAAGDHIEVFILPPDRPWLG